MDKKLHSLKGCWTWPQFFVRFEAVNELVDEFLIHFRTASSGEISKDKCHPFYVNDNLAFMENGNLYNLLGHYDGIQGKGNDVQRLNEEILKKLPEGFLADGTIRSALEGYCRRNFTKMAFMDGEGSVEIVNRGAWEEKEGCWYSNSGIDGYVGYGYSGIVHDPQIPKYKGGQISPMLFPESRRDNWSQCEECKGWFYKLDNICDDCEAFRGLKGAING